MHFSGTPCSFRFLPDQVYIDFPQRRVKRCWAKIAPSSQRFLYRGKNADTRLNCLPRDEVAYYRPSISGSVSASCTGQHETPDALVRARHSSHSFTPPPPPSPLTSRQKTVTALDKVCMDND